MLIRISLLVFLLLLASIANGKNLDSNIKIQAVTAFNGVAFETGEKTAALAVNLSGPAGFQSRKTFSDSDVAYIDINNVDGASLADGLYKYEIKALPANIISREESSKMPDRNDLKWKSMPKTSALNGTFRVINGQVVDDRIEEFGAAGEYQK